MTHASHDYSGFRLRGKRQDAVGKELARRLGRGCYLDKDTVTSPFADRLLRELGRPAGDRDSEIYRRKSGRWSTVLIGGRYGGTDSGAAAILSAPFLAQLVDADWMGAMRREARSRGLGVKTVWVHCDRAGLYQRMVERGSPRDRAKLDDWPTYRHSIDEQFPQRILGEYLLFDNSDNGFLTRKWTGWSTICRTVRQSRHRAMESDATLAHAHWSAATITSSSPGTVA